MSSTTPIFGFIRPSSDDYAFHLGDDMGSTVDRLEAVLYGMGIRVSPDATGLAAEVTARQAVATRVTALEASETTPVLLPLTSGAAVAFASGFVGPRIWRRGRTVHVQGLARLSAAVPAVGTLNVGTIPAGFVPPAAPVGMSPATNNSVLLQTVANGIYTCHLEVLATGVLRLVNDQTGVALASNMWFPINGSWNLD